MQLFAGADADRLHFTTRCNSFGHFHKLHARNFWNKNFASMHLLNTAHHKSDSLIERDPETGHAWISDSYLAAFALFHEHWNHTAPAAQHVSVTCTTESRILPAGIGVRLHEHFLRAKFRGTVQVDGVDGFVCAQRQNATHAAVDCGIHHVAAAHDVGLDGFERIVFACRNLLKRGSVNHHGDSGKCATKALRIAYVADEITQARMVEP